MYHDGRAGAANRDGRDRSGFALGRPSRPSLLFFCSALSSLLFLNVDACTVIVKPKARPEFILSADINGDKQVFLVHDGKKISTEEAARLILEPMLFP